MSEPVEISVTHHAITAEALVVRRQNWRNDGAWHTRIEILMSGTDETWHVRTVQDVEALIELLQDAVNVAKGLETSAITTNAP